MKKITMVSLIAILILTSTAKQTYCMGDQRQDFNLNFSGSVPPIEFSEDSIKNLEAMLNSALISTLGLVICSAGLMLLYKGIIASSQNQQADVHADQLNTTKLLGYGAAVSTIGLATIMRSHISNLLTSSK